MHVPATGWTSFTRGGYGMDVVHPRRLRDGRRSPAAATGWTSFTSGGYGMDVVPGWHPTRCEAARPGPVSRHDVTEKRLLSTPQNNSFDDHVTVVGTDPCSARTRSTPPPGRRARRGGLRHSSGMPRCVACSGSVPPSRCRLASSPFAPRKVPGRGRMAGFRGTRLPVGRSSAPFSGREPGPRRDTPVV